jgi:hypothetical protein
VAAPWRTLGQAPLISRVEQDDGSSEHASSYSISFIWVIYDGELYIGACGSVMLVVASGTT